LASRSLTELKIDGSKSEHSREQRAAPPAAEELRVRVRLVLQRDRVRRDTLVACALLRGKNPDELASLPREEIEELIRSYLDPLIAKGLSKNTVKMRRSYLLLRFARSGFKREAFEALNWRAPEFSATATAYHRR